MATKTPGPLPALWTRLSVPAGIAFQLAGMAAGALLISVAATVRHEPPAGILLLLAGWLSVYVSSHAIGHWAVGRLVGIRFKGFGIRGTDHPENYPPGLRQVMSAMPFFTAITEKTSMSQAQPAAKALMFAAGETATTVFSILAAAYGAWLDVPAASGLLKFAVVFAVATTVATALTPKGDYAKAIRAARAKPAQARVA